VHGVLGADRSAEPGAHAVLPDREDVVNVRMSVSLFFLAYFLFMVVGFAISEWIDRRS
jgi:hypothetical protein